MVNFKEILDKIKPVADKFRRLRERAVQIRLPRPHLPEKLVSGLRNIRPYIRPLASLAGALVLVGAVIWTRPHFLRLYHNYQAKREAQPQVLLDKAQMLAATGQSPDAFALLRRAIDQADNSAERAAAGAAMGRLLLNYGRQRPNPYAQMSRSYLEAALRLTDDQARKMEIYGNLGEVSVLLDDYSDALNFSEQGLKLADAGAERTHFLLARLDALLKIGTWNAVMKAWEDSAPERKESEWRKKFDLREAFILEGALTQPDWFEELLAHSKGREDPVGLRQKIFHKTLLIYDRLGRDYPEMTDGCLFRAARLCSAENQFAEARRRVEAYFTGNFTRHNEDIMLLLTRMSRMDGNQSETAGLMTQCLDRFHWRSRTAPQILELVEAAESVGYDTEALYYLEEYLKTLSDAARADYPRLLNKAGQLAARLGRNQDALNYFNETLAAGADDDLHVATLLAMAEVNLNLSDLPAAQNALITALTKFPYNPRRGLVLYQLVDIFSRSDAPLADILLITTLAVNVAPNDPAAVAVLMQLARLYEKLGLFAEAQGKYAKVALLRTIDATRQTCVSQEESPVSEALLGSARCLLHMGETTCADRVLRELCQINKIDPIQSMAAYLWSTIAMEEKQYYEAKRRLALIEIAHCPANVRARVRMDLMLIDVALDRRKPETLLEAIEVLGALDAEERENYIRRAYNLAFEHKMHQNSPERVQWFVDQALEQTDALPLTNWVMRLADRVLKEEGVPAFINCIEHNLAQIKLFQSNFVSDATGELNALMTLASSLEDTKQRVLEQMD